MTTYTHEQIALMMKLVPDSDWQSEWRPWSDWRDLGPLYLACCKWVADNGAFTDAICDSHMDLIDALESGDFDAFAAAVCNLAIEIGRAME